MVISNFQSPGATARRGRLREDVSAVDGGNIEPKRGIVTPTDRARDDDDAGEDGDRGDAGTRETRANRARRVGGDEERRRDDDAKGGFADAEEREFDRARGADEWNDEWEE